MLDCSANRSLLVVGSVALDDVDGPSGMHPDLLGGSASFIATAASYFTRNVSVVAVIGDDFPARHVDFLAGRGVDVRGIERQPGATFHWSGRYSADLSSRETLDTRLGVFADFRPRLDERHRSSDLLFLGNIDPALQLDVLEQASRPALVAADTMNFWIAGNRPGLLRTLARVHTLVINEDEARELAEEHNLVRAAAKIRAMGPSSVVVKRGDAGALLFHDSGAFFAPALPLEDVRDPTGAGDSFAGGFMGYLAYAGSIGPDAVRTAMIYGSVMASFSVEQFSLDGMRDLTPELIQSRFDAFHALSRFERIALYERCYVVRVTLARLLPSPDLTAAAGAALGRCVEPGDAIGLTGDLGAGKTRFVTGLARGLGVADEQPVTSPTFTLVNEYRGGRLTLHHADLYRIERARELDEIGLDELIGGAGVVAIEWSDRFAVLPADHLRIALEVRGPDTRQLTAEAGGARSAALLAAWDAALLAG